MDTYLQYLEKDKPSKKVPLIVLIGSLVLDFITTTQGQHHEAAMNMISNFSTLLLGLLVALIAILSHLTWQGASRTNDDLHRLSITSLKSILRLAFAFTFVLGLVFFVQVFYTKLGLYFGFRWNLLTFLLFLTYTAFFSALSYTLITCVRYCATFKETTEIQSEEA